jgi:hypothetical protein
MGMSRCSADSRRKTKAEHAIDLETGAAERAADLTLGITEK